MSEEYYKAPVHYLADAFNRIDLYLERALKKEPFKKEREGELFPGLYISEEEVNHLLTQEAQSPSSEIDKLTERINLLSEEIETKLETTRKRGIFLPVDRIRNIFGLSSLEIEILLLALAPQLEARFEKIYAYLQDDATKKYPTLHLLGLLFGCSLSEKLKLRDRFSSRAPLIWWQLLEIPQQGPEPYPFITAPIRIDERIADFLAGSPYLDSKTSDYLEVLKREESIDSLFIPEKLKKSLLNLSRRLASPNEERANWALFFWGPTGGGKKRSASYIAKTLGAPLMELKVANLPLEEERFRPIIYRIIREVLLLQGCLYVRDFDILLAEDPKIRSLRDFLIKEALKYCWITFFSSKESYTPPERREGERVISLHFSVPTFSQRNIIWEKAFNGDRERFSPKDLAGKFQFTEGQIHSAMASARDRTLTRSSSKMEISEEDLLTGCRIQCSHKLAEMAVKVKGHYSWDNLVLPGEQIQQLREITTHLKHHDRVYETWGFGKKISYGRGINVLFSGSSGTGKTMAAGIIAADLRLELYKIDLSTVISKYIGETEKNLSRIFNEARTSNAILFFDEADALFGKRSEVKDSHDRYSNIEIGYLLQKMEEYDGMTILATNLRQNIDDAFVRRMQFIIEFPFPGPLMRESIWRSIYPSGAPLSQNVDFSFLGEKIKLSGGNIKNIALSSCFYAAEEESDIAMSHIMLAVKREYGKLGMSFLKGDLEPYFEIAEPGKNRVLEKNHE